MNYLLSVVIPTKDRYEYLKGCLMSLKNITSDELEVIVQDNTKDNCSILPFIKQIQWNNLKYYHMGEALSVSENSSLAIRHSCGEYVCFIGDDDSICREMVNAVKEMKVKGAESCVFPVARFNWPDMVYNHHNMPSLIINSISLKTTRINPQSELTKQLNHGAEHPYDLPKVYHGIVRRNSLEKIWNKCGTYFPGPSPDMANAVALSLIIKKHYRVDLPLMISGYSYKSGGGYGARGAHKGRLKDMPWLPKDIEEKWETKIPKYWTAETIWAESAIKALKRMNANKKLMNSFNYEYLYSNYIAHHPDKFKSTIKYIKGLIGYMRVLAYLFYIMMGRGKNYILNLFAFKLKKTDKNLYDGIETLEEASKIVNAYLSKFDIKYNFDIDEE